MSNERGDGALRSPPEAEDRVDHATDDLDRTPIRGAVGKTGVDYIFSPKVG